MFPFVKAYQSLTSFKTLSTNYFPCGNLSYAVAGLNDFLYSKQRHKAAIFGELSWALIPTSHLYLR